MQIEIDPIVNSNELWAKAVQRGNTILEKMLGDFLEQTFIRWTVAKDENGLPQLTLELSVSAGEVRASLSDADLTDVHQFWWRLNDTWNSALDNALQKNCKG